MHKAVRTKFILMERINDLESQADIDWNERILNDLNDEFFDSFMNQLKYLDSFHDFNVEELSWVLRISTKTY